MVVTSYTGGQIASATAMAEFNFFVTFCLAKCIFFIHHLAREKKLGFKNLFYPREIGRYFWGVVAVHGLRLPCAD